MMKFFFFILSFLCCADITAQDPIFLNPIPKVEKWEWQRYIAPAAMAFGSGAADGISQVLLFHTDNFFEVHPEASRQYWDPYQSWENKWRRDADGEVQVGKERFWLSSTALVWTTDAYHLMRTVDNTMVTATFLLYPSGKRKWWVKGLEVIGLSLARKAGFHLTYSLIYRTQ